MEEITRCISKKLITHNDWTESTFKGREVIDCIIEPQGVVKATVNQPRGTVSFERYDSAWEGEVALKLETSDGMGSNYINNYNVEFQGINAEDDEEIEELTEEEEEASAGAANKMISLLRGQSKWITAYDGGGKNGYGWGYYPISIINLSGWVKVSKGKVRKNGEFVCGVKLTNKSKSNALAIIQITFKDELSSKKVIRKITVKC